MGFIAVLHFEALSRAIARHATGLVDHVAYHGDLASLGELICTSRGRLEPRLVVPSIRSRLGSHVLGRHVLGSPTP